MKVARDPGEERVEQDVRHERHQRDVQVGRIDVFARGQELVFERAPGSRGGACGGGAEPGGVREREEEDAELGQDVGVCYCEVGFERGEVAVELGVSVGGRNSGGVWGIHFSRHSRRR